MKKILLYGEFSGLHTYLRKGLVETGYDVTLVSFGDDFKNIPGDININTNIFTNKYLRYIYFQFISFLNLYRWRNYDIVQLISISGIVIPAGYLGYVFVRLLKLMNKKVYLNSCGDDVFVVLSFLQQDYSPFQNTIKNGEYERMFQYCNKRNYINSKKIVNCLDGIISSNSTYHCAYKEFKNYTGFVPMPIEVGKCEPIEISEKIKILFGIGSRRALKGVEYVLDALEMLNKTHGTKIEIEILEKIDFGSYKEKVKNCNILIDQACSYSYGMNALLGLSNSKVVLSGNEKIVREVLKKDCPVINIKPNSKQIHSVLIDLISDYEHLIDISSKSYLFCVEVHDYKKITNEYIDKWGV
jgi:hypothetical protein